MSNLLLFKSEQDKKKDPRQYFTLSETVVLLPNILLKINYSDITKIKGFIIKQNYIHKLMNEYLEFYVEETYFKVPFSFLILSDKDGIISFSKNNDTYNFINFPHDYFFNHRLSSTEIAFTSFSVKFTNDSYESYESCDYNIEIVLNKYFLNKKKVNVNTIMEPISYGLRNIQHYEIPFDKYDKTLHVYKLDIYGYLINQGLFIVKNCHYEINNITILLNDTLTVLNYNIEALNNLKEDVRSFIYYGFNVDEKYKSNNLSNCVNLSIFDKLTIIIRLNSLKDEHDNYLDIYMPKWDIITYTKGLIGVKYIN